MHWRCKSASTVDIKMSTLYGSLMPQQLLFFALEIKIIQLRQMPFTHDADISYVMLYVAINIIFFIKDSNRFYSYLQGDSRWQNFEMLTLCPLTLDFLNPKSIGFNTMSRTTTLPSFKSLRWGGGCFIMVTYSPHNYPHTQSDKVIAISVLPCYVVGADNHSVQAL